MPRTIRSGWLTREMNPKRADRVAARSLMAPSTTNRPPVWSARPMHRLKASPSKRPPTPLFFTLALGAATAATIGITAVVRRTASPTRSNESSSPMPRPSDALSGDRGDQALGVANGSQSTVVQIVMPTNAVALSRMLIAERSSLVRRLARIVGSEPVAEDVAQSLYLRVQRIEDDPPIGNKRSFLFRLASNLAVDHIRAERSHAKLQAEAQAFLWSESAAPDSEQIATARVELARVLKAAAMLPEPTRTIFRLHRFEGLRQSEVAGRCGVSVTTVEKHVRRALAILRKARDGV